MTYDYGPSDHRTRVSKLRTTAADGTAPRRFRAEIARAEDSPRVVLLFSAALLFAAGERENFEFAAGTAAVANERASARGWNCVSRIEYRASGFIFPRGREMELLDWSLRCGGGGVYCYTKPFWKFRLIAFSERDILAARTAAKCGLDWKN